MSTGRSCILKCPAEEGTKYFEFPDESKQNNQRNDWIEILQINPAKDVHAYVCERHFSQKQRTLMGLKSTAVPDINLSFSPEFYEMEESLTNCDSPMSETLHTNFNDDKITNKRKSPTKDSIIDEIDSSEEQKSQKIQTNNIGKVSSFYEAFVRNINEGVRQNCVPAKILTTSNQIKGPLKLCTVDAQGNYTPVILKKFKICSQSVDKSEILPVALHKTINIVKNMQTPSPSPTSLSCEHPETNKSLPTTQNKQPKLFSVLKAPSDMTPEETPRIFKDLEAPKLSTNNSIKLLESNSNKIANTTISVNNAKKLNNNVPAALEKRAILPRIRIRTTLLEEGSNTPKKMYTPNSNKMNNSNETVPAKSPYLSSANTITPPLSSDMNSGKVDNTSDEITRTKRSLYMSRVNNIIGSKITVTLKNKSPPENTSLFRRISTEFDSDSTPNVSLNNNIQKSHGKHNAATPISRGSRAISYRCQFPLNVKLQDLSRESAVISVNDDSTDNEVEFVAENSVSDTQRPIYSALQTSSVLGDTDAEDDFFNDFMKPRKPRKKPKRYRPGKKGSKMNRLRREKAFSARDRSMEYNYRRNNSRVFLPYTGRKTPPGLYSVLKEPSETGNHLRGKNVQQNSSRKITKEKPIFCKSPANATANAIASATANATAKATAKATANATDKAAANATANETANPDGIHGKNNFQSVNTSVGVINLDQEIKTPLECKIESIYSRYDSIPFTIDESMMVISRGVQASGDYRYRSPTRIRLEEDVKYLRRTLEEGSEALKTLKITTKNALDILAENDERITNTICAKLPREVAKLVRESLSKKIPYP